MSNVNDELSLQIVATLRSIAQEIDTYSRELWVKFGVTAPQIGVLRFLSVVGEATVTAVCAELRVTQQTMAGILQRLESRRLVFRKRDTVDRRKVILALTEVGKEFARTLPNLLRDQFIERLKRLSASRRQAILDGLVDLSLMLDLDSPEYVPFLFTDPANSVVDSLEYVGTPESESVVDQRSVEGKVPMALWSESQFNKTSFVRINKHSEIY